MSSAELVALIKSVMNAFRGSMCRMLPWPHVGNACGIQSTIGSKKFAVGEVLWITHKLPWNIHVLPPSS